MTSIAHGFRYFRITPDVRRGALPWLVNSPAGGNPSGTGQVVTQISLAAVFSSFCDYRFQVRLVARLVIAPHPSGRN